METFQESSDFVFDADPVGVCFHFRASSSEPVDGFLPNLHRHIVGRSRRVD